MKKIILITFLSLILVFSAISSNPNVLKIKDPLEVICLIGDKLIRDTPFKYRLEVQSVKTKFDNIICVDFGRNFGLGKPAVAIAYTQLESETDQTLTIQVEHNDGCKIILNNKVIYQQTCERKMHIVLDERDVELPIKLELQLKKGINNLIVESQTNGKEWRFYMQPPGDKGAILEKTISYPTIGLTKLENVDKKVAEISNWLLIGPFSITDNQIAIIESVLVFGKMYNGLNNQLITWTVPKVEVLGNVIDPKLWGTNYNWNYHNGGVAWAMQMLSEATKNPAYKAWATTFCDFHINGIPFVNYQVKTLNALNSANHYILKTPLLDFTLAPSMPLIYRLQKEENFDNRTDYEAFITKMLKYAKTEQIRDTSTGVYTRTTPEKYTTWVDDMFMGIPFLVQASKYVQDKKEKEIFLNDAAKQVLEFKKYVWDADVNLYMHANYSARPKVKLPYWSRANGWGIWATSEVLKVLPKSSPYYKPILKHFQTHVISLVKLQAASGFWYNVLNRADSKEEVSGTAIFTMAIARGVTNGWLDRKTYAPIAIKGWEAIKTQIEPDGSVHNICMGTYCSEDVNYYINRPYFDNDTHGIFAVLFAGIEMDRMIETPLTPKGEKEQVPYYK
jgi:rhamnogalacturonyl hydrolase YesR